MTRIKALPSRLQPAPARLQPVAGSWRSGLTSSTARGYDYRWQQYRKAYLARHPLCVKCLPRGVVTPAVIIDHVTPHRGDERLFWDEANHQALCKPCHDSDKAREEAQAGLR